MMIDEHTQNAIAIISKIAVLTEESLLYVMKKLIDFLKDDAQKKNIFINGKTKEGKQIIQDLIKKHNENVVALDKNLTKEQLKDYQREFKKLGVDFSVVKNDKDNYSFFFSSTQANLIEKALQNVAELKSNVLANERVKQAENELSSLINELPEERVNKIKNIYDSLSESNEKLDSLSDKELELFNKYKEVDKIKFETKEALSKNKEPKEITDKTKNIFNMKSVKEIDQKIKQQVLDKNKEKKLENSLSR